MEQGRNAQEIHSVNNHRNDEGPDHRPHHAPFTSLQKGSAQDNSRNGIQRKEFTDHRLCRIQPGGIDDPGKSREKTAEGIDPDDSIPGFDAGEARRFLIRSQGIEICAKRGVSKQEIEDQQGKNTEHDRGRDRKEMACPQESERSLKTRT